jgi:hypothetical protein
MATLPGSAAKCTGDPYLGARPCAVWRGDFKNDELAVAETRVGNGERWGESLLSTREEARD